MKVSHRGEGMAAKTTVRFETVAERTAYLPC